MPEGAVRVTVPPHTVAEAFGTVNPAGKVSVKPTPVSATDDALGLVIVNCSPVVEPGEIADGMNDVASDGGVGMTTLRLALETLPVPPLVEVTALVVLV